MVLLKSFLLEVKFRLRYRLFLPSWWMGPFWHSQIHKLSSILRQEDVPGWFFYDFMVGWASLTNNAAGIVGTISLNRPKGRCWQLRWEVGSGVLPMAALFRRHALPGNSLQLRPGHAGAGLEGRGVYGVQSLFSGFGSFCSGWDNKGWVH